MTEQRLAALRSALATHGWDAFIVSQPENRRYLSGFTGDAGLLLITADSALLLTDFRYIEAATRQAPDFEIVRITRSLAALWPSLFADLHIDTVAFESAHITVSEFQRWHDGDVEVAWNPAENVVETLRTIKEPAELDIIRRAVRLGDEALAHLLGCLRPSMTEREAAWELEVYMRTHGAEAASFDLIVGSGPNGAMPHATTSDRHLQSGEPIVIDMGALVDGYHSDLTRTVCLGRPDARWIELHDLVQRAQLAVETLLQPGMTGQQADWIARGIIEAAGLGEAFGHGLGHGVGLAIHEGPRLSTTSTDVLRPGMVVTIEPGIYLSGQGGIRIEDMAIITENGCEVMSQATKDWILPTPGGPS
jgi:Xaa-Pro aminopeptidase